MDTESVKQIVEAIKTINLNVDSETGLKAIQTIADKIGFWLIIKEVLGFWLILLLIILGFVTVISAYKLILKGIDSDKQQAILRKLYDEEDLSKEQKFLIGKFLDNNK